MQTDEINYEAIKERQRAAWETGDYPRVDDTLQIIAERLVDTAAIHAGRRVRSRLRREPARAGP